MNRKPAPLAHPEIDVPPAHDWRTTDTDEINKRRLRARVEPLHVTEMGGDHPIFANFRVSSASGMSYAVEIRSLRERLFFCTCVDFAFAQAAREKLDDALVRCEESYPLDGAHSVLLVVVERDAALWRDRLAPLHKELFGEGKWDPLAPVEIEVIDTAMDEALRRLADAGLIKPSTRAVRSLWSGIEQENGAAPLSEEARQKVLAHRQQASRKLKVAKLLEGGGLPVTMSKLFLRTHAASRGSNCGVSSRGLNQTTGSRCQPWDPAFRKFASILDTNIESSMWPNSRRASTSSTLSQSEPEKHRNMNWNSVGTGFVP